MKNTKIRGKDNINTSRVLDSSDILDDADIGTVASELGMKPNALYVARERFMDSLR